MHLKPGDVLVEWPREYGSKAWAKKIHPSTQGVDQQPISNYRLEGILESECDTQIFFDGKVTNDL